MPWNITHPTEPTFRTCIIATDFVAAKNYVCFNVVCFSSIGGWDLHQGSMRNLNRNVALQGLRYLILPL
jgi:hypothetical protein